MSRWHIGRWEALLSALRSRECAAVLDDPSLAAFRSSLRWLVPAWHRAGDPVAGSPLLAGEGTLRLLGALAGGRGCVLVLEDTAEAILGLVRDGLETVRVDAA
ncbi:hypothetical protein [Pseudonocardia nigra]|uniref:hypothetical protein n=1 Tax=Pseudonocardia nigra TaxID=1921578 RepID=UPI001C5E6149|nr:hypothetical protein [Pseudonocardia nigra]